MPHAACRTPAPLHLPSPLQLNSAEVFYDRLNGSSSGGSLLKSKRSAIARAAWSSPSRPITRSSRPSSTGMVRAPSVPVCVHRPSTGKSRSRGTWLRPSSKEEARPHAHAHVVHVHVHVHAVPAFVGPAAPLPAAAAIPAAAAGAPVEAGVLPIDAATVATAARPTAAVAAARDEVVASAAQAAKRATEAEMARQRRRVAEYQRSQRQRVQREAGEVPVGGLADWHASSLFTLAAARIIR